MFILLASDFFKDKDNRNWVIAFAVALFVLILVTAVYVVLNKKLSRKKNEKVKFKLNGKDADDEENTETPTITEKENIETPISAEKENPYAAKANVSENDDTDKTDNR